MILMRSSKKAFEILFESLFQNFETKFSMKIKNLFEWLRSFETLRYIMTVFKSQQSSDQRKKLSQFNDFLNWIKSKN